MDPPEDILKTLDTVTKVADWVNLPGDAADATSQRGALFKCFGTDGTHHVRVLGVIDREDFEVILNKWQYVHEGDTEASPPAPVARSQAGLMGRISRIQCGLESTQAEHKAQVAADAAATAALAAAASAGTGAGSPGRKLKTSAVANQMNDEERAMLDAAAITTAYTTYRKAMGSDPPSNKECTVEQLTALRIMMTTRWSPTWISRCGGRTACMLRKIKLTGMTFLANGEMRTIEIWAQPPVMWCGCYDVLETGLISWEAVCIAFICGYRDVIKTYVERYGEAVWHIIYQADCRMRQEQMERIRRRGQEEWDKAQTLSAHHDFEPDKPWNWCWDQAAKDVNFWRKEVEEPCLLVLSKAAPLQTFIEGDANIQGGKGGSSNGSNAGVQQRGQKRQLEDTFASRTSQMVDHRAHNVRDGLYTTNRRGIDLCPGWQDGSCVGSAAGARCPNNWGLAHQCAKCLSSDHGKDQCSSARTPSAPSQPPRSQKGGNKGGGKKGKSKGRGKW